MNVVSSIEEEVWNILYAVAVYCTNIEGSNQNAKAGICTTKEPYSWICRNLCKPALAHTHTERCRSIKGHVFKCLWASFVVGSCDSSASAGTCVYSKGHFGVWTVVSCMSRVKNCNGSFIFLCLGAWLYWNQVEYSMTAGHYSWAEEAALAGWAWKVCLISA